jgi:hypothetical protein
MMHGRTKLKFNGSIHIPRLEEPQILLFLSVSGSFTLPFSDIFPL